MATPQAILIISKINKEICVNDKTEWANQKLRNQISEVKTFNKNGYCIFTLFHCLVVSNTLCNNFLLRGLCTLTYSIWLKEQFILADIDGKGRLNEKEVLSVVRQLNEQIPESVIKQRFKVPWKQWCNWFILKWRTLCIWSQVTFHISLNNIHDKLCKLLQVILWITWGLQAGNIQRRTFLRSLITIILIFILICNL